MPSHKASQKLSIGAFGSKLNSRKSISSMSWKPKNRRISRHRPSQKLSIGAFCSKLNLRKSISSMLWKPKTAECRDTRHRWSSRSEISAANLILMFTSAPCHLHVLSTASPRHIHVPSIRATSSHFGGTCRKFSMRHWDSSHHVRQESQESPESQESQGGQLGQECQECHLSQECQECQLSQECQQCQECQQRQEHLHTLYVFAT